MGNWKSSYCPETRWGSARIEKHYVLKILCKKIGPPQAENFEDLGGCFMQKISIYFHRTVVDFQFTTQIAIWQSLGFNLPAIGRSTSFNLPSDGQRVSIYLLSDGRRISIYLPSDGRRLSIYLLSGGRRISIYLLSVSIYLVAGKSKTYDWFVDRPITSIGKLIFLHQLSDQVNCNFLTVRYVQIEIYFITIR